MLRSLPKINAVDFQKKQRSKQDNEPTPRITNETLANEKSFGKKKWPRRNMIGPTCPIWVVTVKMDERAHFSLSSPVKIGNWLQIPMMHLFYFYSEMVWILAKRGDLPYVSTQEPMVKRHIRIKTSQSTFDAYCLALVMKWKRSFLK